MSASVSDGSVFDDGAWRAPGVDALPRESGCLSGAGGFGGMEPDDVEVVDGFGMPVLPPDHTED
ncbi:hypothetical protein, partial [Myceligenerans halotolerans]